MTVDPLLHPEPASRRFAALPPFAPAMRIGLLGGSFNPPHAAHRAISLFAIKRLGLDAVWWIVSPGNPLKDHSELSPFEARIAAARRVAADPRIVVTGLEHVIGTPYTVDTLRWLRRRCGGVRFVWLMGADNLIQFHRWKDWRAIARLAPIAVVDRGPTGLRALAAPAAQSLSGARLPESRAAGLVSAKPPAWVFLTGMKSPLSSTALRNRAKTAAAVLDS